MASATEERIRGSLVREEICVGPSADRFAGVLADVIDAGDADKVTEDRLARAVAVLNASIAQLAREFAERDAERARVFARHISEMQQLERQRDERERERARDWDERERARDAKWDERLKYSEERDERVRRVVYAGMGLGFSALGLLVAILALVA